MGKLKSKILNKGAVKKAAPATKKPAAKKEPK